MEFSRTEYLLSEDDGVFNVGLTYIGTLYMDEYPGQVGPRK